MNHQKQSQNTGAGSRQQEQANAGGSMDRRDEDSQMEQQGGSYRPEGDRGVEFESDDGTDITMESRQPEQQGSSSSQPGESRRDQQPDTSDSKQRRQAEQQDDGESGRWDDEMRNDN